jgi:hypothetical protein
MKILKYILTYFFGLCSVFPQSPDWFVFQNPNPLSIVKKSSEDWPSINIIGKQTIKYPDNQKNHSIAGNSLILSNPIISTIPDNSIICTVTDKKGNIWIGTENNGLVKFDGTNWVPFNMENSALPDNAVYSLAVDKKNILWVGTRGGLAKFNGNNWTIYTTANSKLPGNVIYAIAVADDGAKWIGSARGLARFDGRTWKIFTNRNSRILDNGISALSVDRFGNLWVGTFEGLLKYDGETWQPIKSYIQGFSFGDIYSIGFDEMGNPLVGTWGSGLAGFDGHGWTLLSSENSSLPDDYVSSALVDKKGTKWVGTLKGLIKYRGVEKKIYNSSNSALPSDSIYSLLSDENGNLWIGTKKGLVVFREGGLKLVPAEVSDFKAEVEDNEVTLTWKSDLDDEVGSFEVEKKTDNTVWEKIGTVYKHQQTIIKSMYVFVDRHNNTGNIQYRLKKITVTGGIKTSSEVDAYIFKPYWVFANIYNLDGMEKTLLINYSISKKGNTEIVINDMYGQRVSTWNYSNQDVGYYQIDFLSSRLAGGTYILKFHTGNKVIVKKFIIY